MMLVTANLHHVTLDFVCNSPDRRLLIDKKRVQQVLINLIYNSIKFSERNSLVLIEVIISEPQNKALTLISPDSKDVLDLKIKVTD